MNKKVLLYMMILILLSSSVYALNLTEGLLAYYSFDGNADDNHTGGYDLTVNNAVNTYSGCKVGGCYDFDGTADYLYRTPFLETQMTEFSIGLCYETNTTNNDKLFGLFPLGSNPYYGYNLVDRGSDSYKYNWFTGKSGGTNFNNFVTNPATDGTQLQCVMIVVYTTHTEVWINATLFDNQTTETVVYDGANTKDFYIGALNTGANDWEGMMDEFGIWNETLSSNKISELQTFYDAGITYPFIDSSGATFVYPTPDDGVHNNTNVTINVSCGGDNVFLYFDNETNPETPVIYNSSTQEWTTNVTLEDIYYYKAGCWNTVSGYSTNTSVRSWGYDVTTPAITYNDGNGFNVGNYSLINQYGDTFIFNMTFTDNIDLYGYQINITNSGVDYYSELNESISGTSFDYYKEINIENWTAGRYNISIQVADSHTAKKIKDYKVTTDDGRINFETAEGNIINITTDENAEITYKKNTDRYVYEFKFDDNSIKDRSFHLYSDKVLEYRENSIYQGHFIVWDGGEGNWIDFVTEENLYSVEKISDYHYYLTFNDTNRNIKFSSLGGLNVYSINGSWYRGTYSITVPTTYRGEPTYIYLNMTHDGSIADINSTLIYTNITNLLINESNTSSNYFFNASFNAPDNFGTLAFHWNTTVLQNDFNITNFNLYGNQTVLDFSLDNCSGNNFTTLRFDTYLEDLPTEDVNVTFEIDSLIWVTNKSNANQFVESYPLNNTFLVCLNNDTITVTGDIYIKYTSPSGFTHRYYLYDQQFNSTQQNFSLYNFNYTTGVSSLELITRFITNYTLYPDVLTKFQRRYISEGVWRTVQMGLSDDFGSLSFNILEEDQDYRLLFYDINNNLLRTTDRLTFFCTAGVCSFTFLLNTAEDLTEQVELGVTIDYDNNTKILTVNYDDENNVASSVRLLVAKQTMINQIPICDETKNMQSGTFTCDLSAHSGQVLVQLFASASPEDPKFSEWVQITRQALSELLTIDDSTLVSVGMIVTLSAIGLFSPVGAIIGAIIGLIIVFFMNIMNAITITFLIISVTIAILIGVAIRR